MQGTELSENSSAVALYPEARDLTLHVRPASKLKIGLLVAAVAVLNSVGNLALAWGMRHLNEQMSLDPLGYIRALCNPFVAIGTALLILWLLSRMTLLSWADLSFVLPLTGLGYVLSAVFGRTVLHEAVTGREWLGVVLIAIGTALVGSTRQRTPEAFGRVR